MKNTFKKIIVKILTWQARIILLRYRPKIIAITGSVGKTSTKDAIFTVLSKFKTVRKSEKSFNSEIGLPLTILGLPNGWNNPLVWLENIIRGFWLVVWKKTYPEWLVLEVGAGKPGDISSITPWLSPDIEFFGTAEKVIEEKSMLAFALKPKGVLILNHDDEKVFALHQKSKSRMASYGMHENATYRATYPLYTYGAEGETDIPLGINFKLAYEGSTFPVMLPGIVGMHYVGQALAAIAVAHEVGCDLLTSINAISEFTTPRGRLSLIEGINESTIIDDTYNASPVAMEAAIEVLKELKGKRKIAVLGDMLELGKYTEEAHRAIGERVFDIADMLVVVGPRAKFIAEGAFDQGFSKKNIQAFDTSYAVAEFLKNTIKKGDLILMKGSQGVRLERAVATIMAHPEDASKLLCRQERQWENR
jgi:UDP-N-acetylmuramoyl-tripeptide--D-alanyl-D-alanine ligase